MEAIVTLQLNGTDVTVGKLFTSIRRGIESAHFTYDTAYMRSLNAVSLCPEMPLSPGTFPAEHNAMHRIFQDCMPDRWGRNLMLRAERQDARSEHRTARTLFEGDLLLSVNDETRQGALRGFAKQAHNDFTFLPCTSWLQSAYGHVSVGRHDCG